MHRLVTHVLGLGLILAVAGCVPNRGSVSPDGKTFYFSLNPDGGFEIQEGSNLYALNIETARLKALTDGPAAKYWCALSSDGHMLAYQTGRENTEMALHLVDLETGRGWPMTGILNKHLFPWIVPGARPVALTLRKAAGESLAKWALYAPDEVPLPLPADASALLGNVGLGPSRCAFAVVRDLPKAKENAAEPPAKEVAVYVADLSGLEDQEPASPEELFEGAAPPKVPPAAQAPKKKGLDLVRVAAWDNLKDTMPIIDMAFSADGKRLVACLDGCGEEKDTSRVVELDPTGKAPPKPLFDAPGAYGPEWTPDGKGIVYFRVAADNEAFREVLVWRAETKEHLLLARLPGSYGDGFACLYWLPDGRLRIYDLSGDGARLIETPLDAKKAKARRLSPDRLKAARRLADLQFALDRRGPLPHPAAEEWGKSYAAQVKAAEAALDAGDKSVKAALEEAWKAVAQWEETPVLPAVPPPAPRKIKVGDEQKPL
jgi:hypothetical protein